MALFEYAIELREKKRGESAEHIVTGLLSSPEQLTNLEFMQFSVLLITAGFETTHTLMAQGM